MPISAEPALCWAPGQLSQTDQLPALKKPVSSWALSMRTQSQVAQQLAQGSEPCRGSAKTKDHMSSVPGGSLSAFLCVLDADRLDSSLAISL